MALLKYKSTNDVITRYVSLSSIQDVNLSVKTALDGTEYMTTFGSPVLGYELELYVNEDGKSLLMLAQSNLTELQVSVRKGTYYGRIRKIGNFELKYYGWYKVNVTLSNSSEVNAR